MVKIVDYESRRRAVLAATIDRYIKQAIPVASEDIASNFDLSSATIRNILAELEEDGYLMHPYTSAGRVPTNKGYRYYVNFLISQMDLLDNEKEHIVEEYKKYTKKRANLLQDIDEILDKTSALISTVTHYTGIASFTELHDRFFCKGISLILDQPEFQDSKEVRLLISLIEDKQRIFNIINRDFSDDIKVYIGQELNCPQIHNCTLIVSDYRIKDKPGGRLAVLGPMRMKYAHTIPALKYISGVLSEALEGI